jgi:acyl CoA:acetate/3-ketoacid CoA transferase alpha subunit/acyl CoA:acetate/3-ketoacid CoA transferase beta subunit
VTEQLSLEEAVERHVREGDVVHVVMGHCRWSAAARALVRRFWDPGGPGAGLTLVMLSLGSLGALFVRGRLVRRVVTGYSGDSFPTYGPNPVFVEAYERGEVEVEHWSFLALIQRLEAAARGLPAIVAGSVAGSSMAENPGYAEVDTPFGRVGLLSPLAPDVALLHAPLADEAGNVVLAEPLLDGAWGAWAARRGAIVTVERVVDRLEGLGHRVRLPAHRVLALVEAPFGAHPGGLYAPGLPVDSYGEDVPFWVEARRAARGDLDAFARRFVLEPADQAAYLERLGHERLGWLRCRADPESWRDDEEAHPVDSDVPPSAAERAAVHAVRELERLVERDRPDVVLAGAGIANLAAWVAVARARASGQQVVLAAELGMVGYEPTPADPYIFNQRTFPRTAMLTEGSWVLGMLLGGPGTRSVACLGAAEVDRHGNLASTYSSAGRFLVGSGGGSDAALRADRCVVVIVASPDRLVERVRYVTGPGERVVSVATDRGILRRLDGRLMVSAVAAGPEPFDERVRAFKAACGFSAEVAREVEELEPLGADEVLALRRYDPERLFLGP